MRAAFIPMYKKIMRTEPAPASLPGSASLVLDMNVLNLHLAVQGLLSLALRVSDIVPELSGGDVLEEHLVNLLEGAVGRLGLVEEEVDPAQDGEAAEDEGRLGAEVGLVGVEDEGQHECCHMVKKPCWMVLDSAMDLMRRRAVGVSAMMAYATAPMAKVVREVVQHRQRHGRQHGRVVRRLRAEPARDAEEHGQEPGRPQQQRAPADAVDDEERADVAPAMESAWAPHWIWKDFWVEMPASSK
jgi:hypothetical protein